MSKSNKFGYVGVDLPSQSFGSNQGVFEPSEINELVANNKWTQYGQLEHIITSTASSSTIDFVDLFNNHDTHLMVFTRLVPTTQTEFGLRVSKDSGSSYETSAYTFANQRMFANGTYEERKSTSQGTLRLGGDVETSDCFNGYLYIYDAKNSLKMTMFTGISTYTGTSGGGGYGSSITTGVFTAQETVNAIRIGEQTTASAFTSGTVSLYGIKEYT